MNADKYDRDISLMCPTCGCTQFEYQSGVDETIELVKCASCGREIAKDDLLRENSENISEHVKEVGDQFVKDATKELKDTLKKAFKGNKNIKFK